MIVLLFSPIKLLSGFYGFPHCLRFIVATPARHTSDRCSVLQSFLSLSFYYVLIVIETHVVEFLLVLFFFFCFEVFCWLS
jgi:hypothetical protein